VETVIRIKNLALNLRTASKVKIRQPLGTLCVRPRDAADRQVLENPDYAAQILEEGNLKRLELIEDEKTLVTERRKPDAKKLGPKVGRYLKAIADALPRAALVDGRYRVEVEGQTFELSNDEVIVAYEGPPNLVCAAAEGAFMALDTAITPELAQEGVARDFNRLVQDLRKTLGLQISDRIALIYAAPAKIAEAIETHTAYLRNELLAERIGRAETLADGAKLSLAGVEIRVSVEKV
jgi:isoleucyl-tRNA synthetase